jgi:hypothetical protein
VHSVTEVVADGSVSLGSWQSGAMGAVREGGGGGRSLFEELAEVRRATRSPKGTIGI